MEGVKYDRNGWESIWGTSNSPPGDMVVDLFPLLSDALKRYKLKSSEKVREAFLFIYSSSLRNLKERLAKGIKTMKKSLYPI